MKTYFSMGLAVLAAGVFAAAAPAQETTTPAPDAMAAPAPAEATPPAQEPAAAPMQQDAMAAPMLEKRDGKWMNGDKPATKEEIAAFKKMAKNQPK